MNSRKALDLKCIECGKACDSATNCEDNTNYTPDEGSVLICLYCGHVSLWCSGAQTEPTTDELIEIMKDYEIRTFLAYRAMVMKEKKDEH